MIRHNSKTIAIALLLLLPALLFGGTGVRATGSSLISTMPIHRFLQLNGTTQYAYIADNPILDMGIDDCMFSWWEYKTTSSNAFVIAKMNTATSGYAFVHTTEDKLTIIDGSGNSNTSVNAFLSLNTWEHVCVVYDASTRKAYIYNNGAYVETLTLTAVVADNAIPFYIGVRGDDIGFFTGKLDEVRVQKFGLNGLYNNAGTFGSSGVIKVGTSTGDLIWSDTDIANSLIYKLYANPYATLTQLGFPSIDNANRIERHDGSGNVTGLVANKWYMFTQGTAGHNLSGCANLTASGVFQSSATTGAISSGNASDSVKEIGEVARWQLDTNLLDTNINGLNLTGVGSPAYGKAGLRAQ